MMKVIFHVWETVFKGILYYLFKVVTKQSKKSDHHTIVQVMVHLIMLERITSQRPISLKVTLLACRNHSRLAPRMSSLASGLKWPSWGTEQCGAVFGSTLCCVINTEQVTLGYAITNPKCELYLHLITQAWGCERSFCCYFYIQSLSRISLS